MSKIWGCVIALLTCCRSLTAAAADAPPWPSTLPRYDHIIIVVEENKDYEEIIGSSAAPYLNKLAAEGATLTHMFGEEHPSEGNYFWLFSGDNQNVEFFDQVPSSKFTTSNLGEQLIKRGHSFKGYSQSLPTIGSEVAVTPSNCQHGVFTAGSMSRGSALPMFRTGPTVDSSSNLRFVDFPSDYSKLPTVAFVVPDMENDMHNGAQKDSVRAGDSWLRQNLDSYYQWAKTHNSLLIVTFDENDDKGGYHGLTDPSVSPDGDQHLHDLQNRIVTIFAGAHVKPNYADSSGMTHVNILRTIEAMYELPKSGAQQANAVRAGISDDATAINVFEAVK